MHTFTFRRQHHWQLLGKIFIILSFCLFLVSSAEAKEVTRGKQASPLTIAFNIVGGSGQCDGTFPSTVYKQSFGDGVYDAWKKPHANPDSPLTLVPAGSSVKADPGTYLFRCTDADSGKYDTDTLIVKDCPVGKTWDGNDCVTPGAPLLLVCGPTSVTVGEKGSFTAYYWATTKGGESCSNTTGSTDKTAGSTWAPTGSTILKVSNYYGPGPNTRGQYEAFSAGSVTVTAAYNPGGGVVNGSLGVTVNAPNLVVASSDLPSSSITKGTGINLKGRVKNAGTVSTGKAFKTNFSYSTNGGSTYTDIGTHKTKLTLAAGATDSAEDTQGFTPNSTGSYIFQYCVDSAKEINESPNEGDNCVTSSVTVVDAGAPLLLVCGPTSVTVGEKGSFTAYYWATTKGGESCSNTTGSTDKTAGSTWAPTGSPILKVSNHYTPAPNTRGEYEALSAGSVTVTAAYNPGGGAVNGSLGVTVTAIPSRTGSISATSCAIPNNGISCSSTVTWSSTNLVTPRVRHNVLIGFTANGSIDRNVSPNNKNFTLSDDSDGALIASAEADVTCAGAPTWNWDGTKCANIPPPLPPPPIDGACGSAQRGYAFNETNFSGAFCSVGSLMGPTPSFPGYGGTAYWQCSGVNGGAPASCYAIHYPPPFFNLSSCSIEEEKYTCNGLATWDMRSASGPYKLKNGNLNYYYEMSVASSGSNIGLPLGFGDNNAEATASGLTLPAYVNVLCQTGLFWHTGVTPNVCKKPPIVKINPSDSLIRKGNYADIEIVVEASYKTECKISGGQTPIPSFTLNGSMSDRTNSTTTTTGPHQATQVYEIECYAPDFPDFPGSHSKVKTRINVLPDYQEL